jgi:hypothetical protein
MMAFGTAHVELEGPRSENNDGWLPAWDLRADEKIPDAFGLPSSK